MNLWLLTYSQLVTVDVHAVLYYCAMGVSTYDIHWYREINKCMHSHNYNNSYYNDSVPSMQATPSFLMLYHMINWEWPGTKLCLPCMHIKLVIVYVNIAAHMVEFVCAFIMIINFCMCACRIHTIIITSV